MALWEYFVLGAVGILCVFSLAIGVEKMMKIILGNYILIALCVTIGPAVDRMMMQFGAQAPDIQQQVGFLFTNKTIVSLVVYVLMFVLVFMKSRLHVSFHLSGAEKIAMTLVAVPMVVVSILMALTIAIVGVQAFDPAALQQMVAQAPIGGWMKWLVLNLPVVISWHAFLTIILTSNISLPKLGKAKTYEIPDVSIEE